MASRTPLINRPASSATRQAHEESEAFTEMDYRAGDYWQRLRDRANVLARTLEYQAFPESSAWSPLTSIGAGRFLHLCILLLWVVSLFFW